MTNIWITVDFNSANGSIFVFDDTLLMNTHKQRGNREFWALMRDYRGINIGNVDIMIRTSANIDYRAFAHWYWQAKIDGKFNTYRLD